MFCLVSWVKAGKNRKYITRRESEASISGWFIKRGANWFSYSVCRSRAIIVWYTLGYSCFRCQSLFNNCAYLWRRAASVRYTLLWIDAGPRWRTWFSKTSVYFWGVSGPQPTCSPGPCCHEHFIQLHLPASWRPRMYGASTSEGGWWPTERRGERSAGELTRRAASAFPHIDPVRGKWSASVKTETDGVEDSWSRYLQN